MKLFKLKSEIRAAGGSRREAKKLAAIARGLSAAHVPGMGNDTKARIAVGIGIGYYAHRRTVMRVTEGAFAALAVSVLVFAQVSKPGTTLYSVKKGTTKVQNFIVDKVPFVGPSKNSNLPKSPAGTKGKNSSIPGDNSGHGGSTEHSGGLDDTLDSGTSGSGTSGGDDDSSGSGHSGSGDGSVTISDLSSGKGRHGSD